MNRAPSEPMVEASPSEPAWDVARLFPDQGAWSEEDYLALDTNHLVEFSHGHIEVLPMPTTMHQFVLVYLFDAIRRFANNDKLGTTLIAPLRVRLGVGQIREPDLIFVLSRNAAKIGERFWTGADLVMEVVSPGDEARRRDTEIKRHEYAQAGIAEYWIVDPAEAKITVLTLTGSSYAVHGEFAEGEHASSVLLPGFTVDVSAALAARG